MSASEPPNVACIRKREASWGRTSGVGGVPGTCSTTSAETAAAGIGIQNLQIKGTGNGGVDGRGQLGGRIELRRYWRRHSRALWRH